MARDLSLDMSSDPDEFEEALREFAARRVISRAEADKLEDYAKRRAWWISGVAQMDIVNDAHRSILEAMRSGIPFEEWQKEAGPKLEAAWGRPDSARLLTIFRNACTQALNSGRWEQMNEPHVKAMRPYVEYDVVDDQRTTEHICRPLIGVVLPIDDPFVLTHNPPLHHRCRTGLRSKRKSYVDARGGVTKDPPEVPVTPGFGYPPDLAEVPKPQHRKVVPDPEIEREMLRKASHDARERNSVKIEQKREHAPEYWQEHYREKYGEAAKQVGYGRALHERAKDMSAKEALEIVQKLEAAKVPGVPAMAIDWLEKQARFPKRAAADRALCENIDAMKLLAQAAKLHGSPPVPLGQVPHEIRYIATKAQQWYATFASPRLQVPQVNWKLLPESREGRAFCDVAENAPHLDRSHAPWQAVHEWGHAVEFAGKLGAKVSAFRRVRETGQIPRKLRDILDDPRFKEDEWAIEDKYWHAYMGKFYGDPDVSEIVSQLFGDLAANQIAAMLSKDPESLYFALGLLGGI